MSPDATNWNSGAEKQPAINKATNNDRTEPSKAPDNDRTEPSHGGSSLQEKPGFKSDDVYEAPFVDGSDALCPRVPGGYLVSLRPGCSVAQHLKSVGFEIPPAGGQFFFADEQTGHYCAHLSDEQLAAVRRDPAVKIMEIDTFGEDELTNDSETDDSETDSTNEN